MRQVVLPERTLYVKRTGLPFYDAARLIGVTHLFFGTAMAEVQDRGAVWEIRGPRLVRGEEQILWLAGRLALIDSHPTKATLAKFVDLGRQLADNIDQMEQYFSDPLSSQGTSSSLDMTNYMDSAMQRGIRGVDPKRYADFASGAGQPGSNPREEVYAAVLGLAHAAVVNRTVLVLPIFGSHFTVGRLTDYDERISHANSDSFTAQVYAALRILSDIGAHELPIEDFAYNSVDRPVYRSGYFGFGTLCQWWQRGPESRRRVLHGIKLYLDATRYSDVKRGREIAKMALSLARAAARFAVDPAVDELTLIVRLKARLFAASAGGERLGEAWAARALFAEPHVAQEAGQMSIGDVALPEIPDRLTWALAKALDSAGKGWMNRFVKLENAAQPDRFLAEVERIVSRAAMGAEGRLIYQTFHSESAALTEVARLSTRDFRAYKAVFLLQVLSKMRSAEAAAPPTQHQETGGLAEATEEKTQGEEA
jgi:hypothetical protein